MRNTRTYAILSVSQPVFDEIRGSLLAAGYSHAVDDSEQLLDMDGIALGVEEDHNEEDKTKKCRAESDKDSDQPDSAAGGGVEHSPGESRDDATAGFTGS